MIHYDSPEQEAAKFHEVCLILAMQGVEEDFEEIEDMAYRVMCNPAHYPTFFPGTYNHA